MQLQQEKLVAISYGKDVGDELDFGGLLGAGPVMPISQISNDVMINRGGRIPAPLQALKN